MAELSYTSPIGVSVNTQGSDNLFLGSVGYFEEPVLSENFDFPVSLNPANSNSYIDLTQNVFNSEGPISFSDIRLFIEDAKGLPVTNYSLNNFFLEAEQYNISLSEEADFLKPHKVSEFYSSSKAGIQIDPGPYGSYRAWVDVLKSEGGYGHDGVIEEHPVADGAVRILSGTISPSVGDTITVQDNFLAFTLHTDAPAGKWIKYRIKCYENIKGINLAHVQNIWPLFDFVKSYVDFAYSQGFGATAKANLMPLTSMSKTYASLAGLQTNKFINFGGTSAPYLGVGVFSYSLNPVGQSPSSDWIFYISADPSKTDDTLIYNAGNGYVTWVAWSQALSIMYALKISELENPFINLFYTNYSNSLSLGDINKSSLMRICYEMIRQGRFIGNVFDGSSKEISIYKPNAYNKIGKLPLHNGSSSPSVNNVLLPSLGAARFNNSMQIYDAGPEADVNNLHTVLEVGYFDAQAEGAMHDELIDYANTSYWYQEGMAYIQEGENGINEALAKVHFPINRYPEGNISIEAENISEFALTKVEIQGGGSQYGIVSGQQLLNLNDLQSLAQTNESLTQPSVSEKNTAKIIFDNFYEQIQPYYINNINDDDSESDTNFNWCHLRTVNYVNVNGSIKQDLFSQHQHDTFSAYYDKIQLTSPPKQPTRENYKIYNNATHFPNSSHKRLPEMFVPRDVQELDQVVFNMFNHPSQLFKFVYEYDIPAKFKNHIESVEKYLSMLLYNYDGKINNPGVLPGLTTITVKKYEPENDQDPTLMGTIIDSFLEMEDHATYSARGFSTINQGNAGKMTEGLIVQCPGDVDTYLNIGDVVSFVMPAGTSLFVQGFLIDTPNDTWIDPCIVEKLNYNGVENQILLNTSTYLRQYDFGRWYNFEDSLFRRSGTMVFYSLDNSGNQIEIRPDDELSFFLVKHTGYDRSRNYFSEDVTAPEDRRRFYPKKISIYINPSLLTNTNSELVSYKTDDSGNSKYSLFNNFSMIFLHEMLHGIGFAQSLGFYIQFGWNKRLSTENYSQYIKDFIYNAPLTLGANEQVTNRLYTGSAICFLRNEYWNDPVYGVDSPYNLFSEHLHYTSIHMQDGYATFNAETGKSLIPHCEIISTYQYKITHNLGRSFTKYHFFETICDMYMRDITDESEFIISSVQNNADNTVTTVNFNASRVEAIYPGRQGTNGFLGGVNSLALSPSFAMIYNWIYCIKHLKSLGYTKIVDSSYDLSAIMWSGIHFEKGGSHVHENNFAILASSVGLYSTALRTSLIWDQNASYNIGDMVIVVDTDVSFTYQCINYNISSSPWEDNENWIIRPDKSPSWYFGEQPILLAATYPYELASISTDSLEANLGDDFSWITIGLLMDLGIHVNCISREQFEGGLFFGEASFIPLVSRAFKDRWSNKNDYDSFISFPSLEYSDLIATTNIYHQAFYGEDYNPPAEE